MGRYAWNYLRYVRPGRAVRFGDPGVHHIRNAYATLEPQGTRPWVLPCSVTGVLRPSDKYITAYACNFADDYLPAFGSILLTFLFCPFSFPPLSVDTISAAAQLQCPRLGLP